MSETPCTCNYPELEAFSAAGTAVIEFAGEFVSRGEANKREKEYATTHGDAMVSPNHLSSTPSLSSPLLSPITSLPAGRAGLLIAGGKCLYDEFTEIVTAKRSYIKHVLHDL